MKIKSLTVLLVILVMLFSGCSSVSEHDETTIRVGALPTPNAEILENAQTSLAQMGYTLEIYEYSDYTSADLALLNGEIDANYVQNLKELEIFNRENNSDLVSLGSIHSSPQGLYMGKTTNLNLLSDTSTILIPSEPVNKSRALHLLEKANLIKLRKGDELVDIEDIIENPKSLNFQEMPAREIARNLNSQNMGIVDGSATRS